MRRLVSRSKIPVRRTRITAGAALLGVSVLLGVVVAFPAAASTTHQRWHKGGGVTVTKAPYGTLDDGRAIDQYTLSNHSGMTVKIITYGGIVTEIDTPDRHGKTADVALGFDNLADYVAKSPYFGAIIGRYANRIAKGTFSLDGTTYTLAINNGVNALHGGLFGRMCGIATLTREYVKALEGTKTVLLDTRKTTPGLRILEKSATVIAARAIIASVFAMALSSRKIISVPQAASLRLSIACMKVFPPL